MAKPDAYKPTHRCQASKRLQSLVQPWWQYAADITMFSKTTVKEAMNKELAQLFSKESFEEIGKNSLTPEQLQQVVATRWVITQSPSNNGTKDIKCRV
eukprot:3969516-Amphidinium_carterae.2